MSINSIVQSLKVPDVAHLFVGARIRGMKTGRLMVLTPNVLQYATWKPDELQLVLKRRYSSADLFSVDEILSCKEGLDILGLIDSGLAIASDDPAYFPEGDAYSLDTVESYGSLSTKKKDSSNPNQ
jgi:hypothetical protein